jgi:hypothetical protein
VVSVPVAVDLGCLVLRSGPGTLTDKVRPLLGSRYEEAAWPGHRAKPMLKL